MPPRKKDDGGWILPAVVDPPDRICVCIPVPDEPAHRQAFWGALTELGYQHNWQRDATHKAVPVSVLWYAIVAQAQAKFYSGVRTMCFSCEELAACLEPLLEGLSNQIIQQMTFNQYGTEYPTGQPLPPEATAEDMAAGTNPTCDYDVLWAQCWQAVTYADILITDALELAESATNDVELVQVITALPVIDELGGDAIAAYIEVLLEGVTDNYAAQVTEAYLQQAACELFCLCKGDCVVNLDRLYKVYYDRMVAAFGTPSSAFTTVTDLLLYVIDQEIEGTLIADALNMVIWGGGVLSNQFLGDVGTISLVALLSLAVNDANNDWEVLCIDCPSCEFEVAANIDPFPPATGQDSDIEVTNGLTYIVAAAGEWNGGAGGDVDADGRIGEFEPASLVPTANIYSLVWKIGAAGTWQAGGVEFEVAADDTADLFFAMNDVPTGYSDNTGNLCITVTLEP